MISLGVVNNVIGMRGFDPHNHHLKDFELIDRLDGQGVQLRYWNEQVLGELPTAQEMALAAAPRLSLTAGENAAGTGVIVTCQLDDSSNSVINWRCIAPNGQVHTVSEAVSNGQDTWEILTGQMGSYVISAWSPVYGYAEISVEGV